MFLAWPGLALSNDTDDIRRTAREIRLRLSELDGQLKDHLRRALVEFGDRPVACPGSAVRKSLLECIREQEMDLTRTPITIATADRNKEDPMADLTDTEERFALFTEHMNRTNDLLASAGARLYRNSLDIAPEMDQLRRNVIVYVDRKRTHDLRAKQAVLIATVTLVLIGIFTLIFMVVRRLR